MTKVFFGFGHGFGGTHLLAKLLDINPNIDCKHERKCPQSTYSMFDRYMEVFDGKANAADVVKQERLRLIAAITRARTFGEVNGILGFFVNGLYEVWPNAKFIHMVRSPLTQVRTAYNTGIFDKAVERQLLAAHPEWDSIWWWPRPQVGSEMLKKWDGMNNLQRNAWFWSAYNEFVLDQLENIPKDQVFTYKFEDMIMGKRLAELYSFLNIPKPSEAELRKVLSVKHGQTSARVSTPLPKWNGMSAKHKSDILSYVKDTMKKLNYSEV